jgi:hypothetical protein
MMTEGENDKVAALQLSASGQTGRSEDLPFAIEVWDERNAAAAVERVIARATNQQLARAIFGSARKEYPERRITVRCGSDTILDSTRR